MPRYFSRSVARASPCALTIADAGMSARVPR